MSEQNVSRPRTAKLRTEVHATDAEAAVVAGGVIVGTAAGDELLVEGPNSK